MRRGLAAAAAVAALLTVGVNTSEAFAKGLTDIPVIGNFAQIVTFRSYETEVEDVNISVEIPNVEMISKDLSGLENEVNEEIHAFCEQYAEDAIERAEEYKQAFLETAGTQEEWAEHEISIRVWYEVKSHTDQYLSLAVMGSENWTDAYGEGKYYTFDFEKGEWVTLADLLGTDYAEIAKQSVYAQAEQREKETEMEFWLDEWKGVNEDTKFYVNQNGNPVIVFEKYEIAPGAAGSPEFEITR